MLWECCGPLSQLAVWEEGEEVFIVGTPKDFDVPVKENHQKQVSFIPI